jgi:hypothetical protein
MLCGVDVASLVKYMRIASIIGDGVILSGTEEIWQEISGIYLCSLLALFKSTLRFPPYFYS